MKLKKLFALMTIIPVLLTALVSCAEKGETGARDEKSEISEEAADANTVTEPAFERVYPNLEPKDFGGYEFTFFSWGIDTPDWKEWDHRDFSAEEENGDLINDTVYNRNRKIEGKYNISIKEINVQHGEFSGMVTRTVKSGEDIYDVVAPQVYGFTALAQGGNFVDWFSIPNLDLGRPWWDQGTINDLSIIKKLFILQGDLLIIDNDAMEAMIFNKALLRDNGLENPYDIVKSGEWTIYKLIEMSKGVARDLNGDGKMYIKDDLFGCITQADSNVSFFTACGDKIAAKDENDYPIVTFGTEKSYKITDAISELMLDEDNVVHLHRYEGEFPIYDEQVKMM